MSERPELAAPVSTAGATGNGWRLDDESAPPKLLVYEDFSDDPGSSMAHHLRVAFGASAAADGGMLICGVRPGEWLLLGAAAGEPRLTPETVTVDLTHGLAMFRLSGVAAPALLAHVCSIDTAEEMMPDGAVCGASVARVACSLVRNDVGGERSYLILANRSNGRYLFDALQDAGGPGPPGSGPSPSILPGKAPPN